MKCIICGCNTTLKNNYYFCSCCNVVFKSKDLFLTSELEKKRYESHVNSINDVKYIAYFKNYIDSALIPFISGVNGLDYGSGKNKVLEQILVRDYKLNVDSYDKYFVNDTQLKNKYDFITCTEVIEHVDDPISFLKELDMFLDQGKTISIMTKLIDNVEDFFNWWYIRDDTHICFFSIKTFEFIAKKMNYEIVYTNNIDTVVLKKR